ncbi:MAG: class I SAM-dependent methyltransferase [Chloroflexota bacterium]|nr:class I SAM-dependent methyltransferase [Anaerolineales bacterium]MCA9974325.1 class I SAM-dependent methyltransferase [Anaerolineales bacterium]MCB8967706.1 class I SAM-dependent methyltransferase [Ardenticatenaceae bacterium]
MKRESRYRGAMRHINAYWPLYALMYAGLVLAVLVIGVSAIQGWPGPILLALAFLLVMVYALMGSLWSLHQLYDVGGLEPHHTLFDMGQIRETDHFAFIDLGRRQQALAMGRRLTSGQIYIIDVYNPQLTPSRGLARSRARMPQAMIDDPRFTWRNGRIDLLPLPNESISAVILDEILSEFWQIGDQEMLLREVRRVLVPNGRLLIAERTRTRTNNLVMGPMALGLAPTAHWRNLLHQTGFIIRREQTLDGLIHCIRADKPTAVQAQQLQFEWKL